MAAYPESVSNLIDEFARLPGIGRRSAERLAFFVLKSSSDEALGLARSITRVKESVRHCSICWNLADVDPCPICSDPKRDASVVLVVEQPRDLISLEQTGMHAGVYHVLLGRLDPLDGVGPDGLTVDDLIATGGADDAVCLVRASLGGGASADAGPAAALQLLSTTPAAHAADVNCVAWRPMVVPAPCLATAGDDGRVCLWRPV